MVELKFVFSPSSPDQLLSDEVDFRLLLLGSKIHIYNLFSCDSFNWRSTGDIDLRDCHIDMEALKAEQISRGSLQVLRMLDLMAATSHRHRGKTF